MSLYGTAGSGIRGGGSGGGGGSSLVIGPIDSVSPSADGAVITAGDLIMQSASAMVPGLVNNAAQTFTGVKTFNSGLVGTLTGSASLNVLTSALGNLTDVGTDGITVTGGTGAVVGAVSLAQHVADTTHNGYLSSTDWNTFNNKQSTITTGNLTDVGTDGITVTGGTGAVVGSGTSISQHVADASHNGYLSSTDWSTFNNKQAAGNYITALTGDVTASGPGSVAATLATVNANIGTFAAITVNAKGLATAATALTGDITSSGAATTLATVNSNVGSFTNAAITVNGKGLITAASSGTTGNLTDAGTDGITVTGGTGAVLGSGTSIAQHVADGSHNGYLSSTDWTTFNGKGSGTVTSVTFTGDGTVLSSTPSSAVTTSGTVTASLKTQTARTFLQGPTSGAAANPTFAALTVPTVQKFTSGSGTYTTPTNPVPLYIRVQMAGGGGGGGGSGTSFTAGTNGNNSTFGTSLLSCNGGTAGGSGSNAGGAGGTASLGSGPIGVAITGATGTSGPANPITDSAGAPGGANAFGGAGAGGTFNAAGSDGVTNTGGGGGGGGAGAASVYNGAGGGAGGYVDAIITSPTTTYSYAVGASVNGGTAGTSGSAGGHGAAGIIIVYEYYQ